jgi:methyl-accepting chemotaxis protein
MAWKNIKIQGKFVIGFGAIILLLVVLSIISIFNIKAIVNNAETVIGGNKLRSELIQREVDHLNWSTELSNFISDENLSELTVETDPRKCDFGVWYYGEGRKEAEILVPQIHNVLEEIEEYHTKLHESAISIEEHHSSIDASLGNFLREKEVDLLLWKSSLLNFIIDDTIIETSVQTDPLKCSLGVWLHSENLNQLLIIYPELGPDYRKLLTSHEELHQSAITVQSLVSAGRTNDALQFYNSRIEILAEETISLLKKFIVWHDNELTRMALSRNIYATETIPALSVVQAKLRAIVDLSSANIMTEDFMLISARENATVLLIISLIIGITAILIAFVLARSIVNPIIKCVAFADQISTGDLEASLDIFQKDQIGELCDSLRQVVRGFQEKADVVRQFANGDLTASVVTLSNKDGLGISLQTMKRDLNVLLGQISGSVDQISSGSEQIAQASQNLSEGAASQASSTEEVSVMVNQISGQASQNSDNAVQAKGISEKATLDAEKGNRNMAEVVSLMEKINDSADDTKKIVKVIDDIAFQINLLALNANVEAARAGKYGKGFAVVADEVRNLAVKSAQSAKETSEKVEESIKNIKNGSDAVQVSASQLEEIVKGSRQVSEILEEIAAASKSQDNGISQATNGLDQIDKITQENTGSAEETAAASEELSSQSLQLKALVDRFKLESEDSKPYKKKVLSAPELPEKKFVRKETLSAGAPLKKEPVSVGVSEQKDSYSTGIKPVNPAEIISLDDNDFDQF